MAKKVQGIGSTSKALVRELRALDQQTAPVLRALLRRWSRQLADASGRDIIRVALDLLELDDGAYRSIGCALIHQHQEARNELRPRTIERLGRGMDNWGDVDTFAVYISGPAWRRGNLTDGHIHRWARSKDRWWRRAALVSTVPLNRKSAGGTGDTPRTLEVCRMLVDDRDDMVVKAMSWALRDLIARDAKAVRRFLTTYRGRLAARVVREVDNKLTTGVKNPRRRKPPKASR